MPKMRNGRSKIQTIGYRNSAANAKGQQSMKSKHHSTKVNIG